MEKDFDLEKDTRGEASSEADRAGVTCGKGGLTSGEGLLDPEKMASSIDLSMYLARPRSWLATHITERVWLREKRGPGQGG